MPARRKRKHAVEARGGTPPAPPFCDGAGALGGCNPCAMGAAPEKLPEFAKAAGSPKRAYATRFRRIQRFATAQGGSEHGEPR